MCLCGIRLYASMFRMAPYSLYGFIWDIKLVLRAIWLACNNHGDHGKWLVGILELAGGGGG